MTFRRLIRTTALREGLRRVRRIRGRRLLLIHQDGCTHVVDDHCPHMGARLARGHVDEGTLWCPKHGFRFDLASGERVAPPVTGGRPECLAVYAVREEDGWLGVDLD